MASPLAALPLSGAVRLRPTDATLFSIGAMPPKSGGTASDPKSVRIGKAEPYRTGERLSRNHKIVAHAERAA